MTIVTVACGGRRVTVRWCGPWCATAVLVVGAVSGCSSDGAELSEPDPVTTTVVPASAPVAATTDPITSVEDTGTTMAPASSVLGSATVVTPAFSVIEVPEGGVPGLDSPDQFCSSWSRFGGSFQVVSVASAFLAAEPDAAFVIEVAAAPVVSSSFESLLAAWPEELDSEYATNATIVFGPFASRADDAVASLVEAGATDDDLAALDAAWVSALEQRDPTTPEVALVLPADLEVLVDAASADFAEDHPTVFSDPALVNEVGTPLTDQYLAVTCPDQGSLSGGEVEG